MAQRFGAYFAVVLFIGVTCSALAARTTTQLPADELSHAGEVAEQLSENVPSVDAAAFKKTMSAQVAQLDYVGFKVTSLLSPSSVNWTQVPCAAGSIRPPSRTDLRRTRDA